MKPNSFFERVLEEVRKIPVIDTHEHLPPLEEYRDREFDVLKEYLSHYMSSDLMSAGLSAHDFQRVVDTSLPIVKRWELVEPYWEVCRYTGYGRALERSVQAIYGLPGINRDTIADLNEAFRRENQSAGHFRHVLKDLCNIKVSILDAFMGRFECDKSLFRRVWQPSAYMIPMPMEANAVAWLENTYDLTIKSLDDWIEAFSIELEDNLNNGVIALKNSHAYMRSLRYEKVKYRHAAASFSEALRRQRVSKERRNIILPSDVQDFMMHHILSVANEKGLVYQFHTGLQEGNGNVLGNSDPALLNNLFLEYPNVKFDLFHISYPFQNVASALAKTFPNVYIDMCWAHIISPSASIRALSDFLDAIPYNKISGFGGDYLFVDGVYGHLQIAQENISWTLAEKLEQGVFSFDIAVNIAKHLLYENPLKLFSLHEVS